MSHRKPHKQKTRVGIMGTTAKARREEVTWLRW